MKITTDFLPPPEIAITEEALAKLIEVASIIQTSITKSWAALPRDFQSLFESVSIQPNLRDLLPDQIIVEIKIFKTLEAKHTTTTLNDTGITFSIECLAPNIEQAIEETFGKVAIGLIRQISQNVKEFSSSLEALLPQES